ncbi:MAG: hypothetical protein ACWA44_15850 [Thiotrichales bacterium]
MTEELSGQNALQFDSSSPDTRAEYERALSLSIQHLENLPESASEIDKARVKLDIAQARTGLGETAAAWELAKEAFDLFVSQKSWQDAVESCEVLYQTGEPAAAVALAHGAWLGITYPVESKTTLTLLNYMVDEMPANSDGAAVSAATAHYIVSVRASDDEFDDLSFLSRNLIAKVAERHSQVATQEALDIWLQKLELTDPADFLPRMGKVLDIIVMDQWWIDRDALRAELPIQ